MYKENKVTAIVLCAGASRRMGFDKLFHEIENMPVLWHSVNKFDMHSLIDDIVVVAGQNIMDIEKLFEEYPTQKPLKIVSGGSSRMASVMNGANAASGDVIAIHDGARPFVSADIIQGAVQAAEEFGAAAPAVPVKDTIKAVTAGGTVSESLRRESLVAMQTPQVFKKIEFILAAEKVRVDDYEQITDDCMIMEKAGYTVKITKGDYSNYKITTQEDIAGYLPSKKECAMLRIGHGYDVHKFAENRKLIMGGVEIPHEFGLAGHSDADVVLHAVADALLGALALGDIGKHFPDTAEEYKGADSFVLLCSVAKLVFEKGYTVQNLDATILCQAPKLAPYIEAMRARIAQSLATAVDNVSVKATTEEGLGFTGKKEGIAAHCVVLLAKKAQ